MQRTYKIKAIQMPNGYKDEEGDDYTQFVVFDQNGEISLWEDAHGEVEDTMDCSWSDLNPTRKKDAFKSVQQVKEMLVEKGFVAEDAEIIEIM
jgi:hypothetical protein